MMKKTIRNLVAMIKTRKIPAYLHIPKTGGTYISQRETDDQAVIHPVKYLGHKFVIDRPGDHNVIYLEHDPARAKTSVIAREKIEEYYHVFSTVRNIFDWLVSYASHAGGWNSRYRDTEHYDYEVANKGFEYLLKTIADRENQWPSRKFIHCQLFSSSGDLIVDWLNSTRSLDEDLGKLAEYYRCTYTRKERQRVGERKDYRSYYTDELIDLVHTTWRSEIKLLGFEFDGAERITAHLGQIVSKETRKALHYDWKDNVLTFDGEIFS
ncbi:MAG: hypothetical protein QGH40_16005 [bacterium]|jgi:hypothetical protein|nr:hypothetical protein [bacterium]